ncbi:hypothetical protein [Parvibaculum sp.]|uniref:hypothetical protein n=1 Tax=Parvibaculum sp. TaxID=2024848 RepID=UPI0034A049A9
MAAWARLFKYGTRGAAGAAALSISFLLVDAAQASDADSALDPAALCESATFHHETENALPRALLTAVSLAESGRFDARTRQSRAWPWTINAEGRGYYFKTKEEAVRTTQRLLDSGMRSIDIGCMQINLRYHPDAFASLEDGFDPMTNVAYSADFLKRLHAQTGSWPKAVAHYHSQTAARGGHYFARVVRIWENERTRIASASYVTPAPYRAARIDLSGELKPAIAPSSEHPAERPVERHPAGDIATASIARPAPKVLDPTPGQNVREAAVAAVGLRLSIANGEFEVASKAAYREPPRVLDPVTPERPTRVAGADIPGA